MSNRLRAIRSAATRALLLLGLLALIAHGFGHPHLDRAETHSAEASQTTAPAHDCHGAGHGDDHSHRDERPMLLQSVPAPGEASPRPFTLEPPAAGVEPARIRSTAVSGAERLVHLCVSRI